MVRALITGITGQIGSIMARFLLNKGYEVWGLVRRSASPNWWRIEDIRDDIHFIEGDLTDQNSLDAAIKEIRPHEVYNYAAQSFVQSSWIQPEFTANVTGLGCLRLLEAVKKNYPVSRFFQSSSSEMFGNQPAPQNEETPFKPISPYGCSKAFAHNICISYRESYGLFVACGISFNMESEFRDIIFVTRKISNGVAQIKLGLSKRLVLGNLEAKRDWGYAPEYCVAHWKILQQEKPEEFVLATGETHTVKEFLILAFKYADIDNWYDHVVINDQFKRPAEVHELRGDFTKAKKVLNWQPETKFEDLVKIMVEADILRLERGRGN